MQLTDAPHVNLPCGASGFGLYLPNLQVIFGKQLRQVGRVTINV